VPVTVKFPISSPARTHLASLAADPAKEGIKPEAVSSFLTSLSAFKKLEVVGLSSMGWGEYTEAEKRTEFKSLIALRNNFIPDGKTSAGTSRDYKIALSEGIDIVRIGKGIWREDFDL
jgi:uncharacterized pyridoxal phosphate-containing UPF0001 family protein